MKKLIVVFIFILVSNFQLIAQNNSVNIFVGRYDLYHNSIVGNNKGKLIRLIGIDYNRKLNDKLEIGARFFRPSAVNPFSEAYMGENYLSSHLQIKWYDDEGKLYNRKDYHYWDLGVRYEMVKIKKHSFNIIQYLSLAHGKDSYVDKIIAFEYPNEFHIIYLILETKKASYWGGVTGIDYNYHLWNDKVNIGAEVSARYYLNNFPFQLSYGLRIGYNF